VAEEDKTIKTMKSFNEITDKETKIAEAAGFPTFSQVVHGEIEEGFTGKDNVSVTFEKLHALQLEMQKLQTQMLTVRTKYMSFAKEAPQRKTIADELIALSKKKKDLDKKIHDAEVASQRALASDDMEIADIDLL
jgi:hypothetical protein